MPQEADHRRRKRSTETLPPTKRVMRPTSYIFNENTLKQTSSILIVSDAVISTNSPNRIVVQQVGAKGQSLISHDNELVRSNRQISLKNICKHRLSKWAATDNEIFKPELGIVLERGTHIMSNIGRLQTTYQQAYEDPGQWFYSRFEELNLLLTREVVLIAEETLRQISISLPLPPMVLKLLEAWYWPLRNTIIDFIFHLNIRRTSSIVSDCENGQSDPIKYLCKASPIMRLEDGTSRTEWDLADRVLKVGNTPLIQELS